MPIHNISSRIKNDTECGLFNAAPGVSSISMYDTHFEIAISPNHPIPDIKEVFMGGERFPVTYTRGKVYSLASPQLLRAMMARSAIADVSCRTCHHETMMGGIAISHRSVTSGTLGGFVFMNEDSRWAGLTNYHVGAGAGAMKGDDWLQPGRVDDPAPKVWAKLERYVPVKFLSNPNEFVTHDKVNRVDAAIGRPLEEVQKTRDIIDMGFPQGTKPAFNNMAVKKSGRTSGTNTTMVKSAQASIRVNYGTDENPKFAVFDDLIEIGPSILPGDSGSFLFSTDGYVVGLVFAGSFDENMQPLSGYACKIGNVLKALNCTMLRQSTSPPPMPNEDIEYPSAPISIPEIPPDIAPYLIIGLTVIGVGLITNFKYEKVLEVLN